MPRKRRALIPGVDFSFTPPGWDDPLADWPPEETRMDHYRDDNTTGYTQAELDALNAELAGLLADLAARTDGNLSPDEVDAVIKRHADDVARR